MYEGALKLLNDTGLCAPIVSECNCPLLGARRARMEGGRVGAGQRQRVR